MLHSIDPKEHGPHGPAMADAVSKCVHCGFCLAACPTYQELGQESDSPRGRIVLMKEVLEGNLSLQDAAPHIDACLGCLACEPACPSGVPYRDLISPFRATTQPQRSIAWMARLRRLMIEQTLPYPKRFRWAALSGKLVKPLARFVPGPLRVMLDLLPESLPARQTWATINAAKGVRRGRVALLTGCAQSVLDPDINTATIDVLTRCGVDVIVPENQTCCGALSWHVGNLSAAQRFARQNLKAFPQDVDAIITNAAGCGSGMHEYGQILCGSREQAEAEAFSRRVLDVSVYLSQIGSLPPIPDRGRTLRVAYHDACHLSNAQNIRRQPREILRCIPGVELLEIAESHLCCGSAGTYNVDHPDIADSLGRQKTDHILAAKPDVIASGNIGCLNQIRTHLRRRGDSTPVRHTIQILRDAYHC